MLNIIIVFYNNKYAHSARAEDSSVNIPCKEHDLFT